MMDNLGPDFLFLRYQIARTTKPQLTSICAPVWPWNNKRDFIAKCVRVSNPLSLGQFLSVDVQVASSPVSDDCDAGQAGSSAQTAQRSMSTAPYRAANDVPYRLTGKHTCTCTLNPFNPTNWSFFDRPIDATFLNYVWPHLFFIISIAMLDKDENA